MTRQLFIRTVFFTLMLSFTSFNGQVETSLQKDSLDGSKVIPFGQPKVIKNHFLSLPDEFLFVRCGLQDKAGNMWFGSAGDGVYFYDGTSFINFTVQDGLCHNDVLCVLEDKAGNIWFGTRGGLCRYKPSAGRISRKNFSSFPVYTSKSSDPRQINSQYGRGSANNFVWSILQDKTGKLWFGTNEGVYIYNPSTSMSIDSPVFTCFSDNDSLIKNNLHLKEVTSMLEDKNGHIWFASGYSKGEGICRFDGKSITSFKPDSLKSFSSIVERKNGHLLFLHAVEGIYSYDGKSFSKPFEDIRINNGAVTALKEDRSGNLWFGISDENMESAVDGGVLFFDGQLTKHFTKSEGLSNNRVFCIVEDKDGDLWFGTRNTGLCRYDGKIFTDYTE